MKLLTLLFLVSVIPVFAQDKEPKEPARRPANRELCSLKNIFVVGNNPSAIWIARNLPPPFMETIEKSKADAVLEVSMYAVFERTRAVPSMVSDFTNSISATLSNSSGSIVWREYHLGEYWRISSLNLLTLLEKDLASLHCDLPTR